MGFGCRYTHQTDFIVSAAAAVLNPNVPGGAGILPAVLAGWRRHPAGSSRRVVPSSCRQFSPGGAVILPARTAHYHPTSNR